MNKLTYKTANKVVLGDWDQALLEEDCTYYRL